MKKDDEHAKNAAAGQVILFMARLFDEHEILAPEDRQSLSQIGQSAFQRELGILQDAGVSDDEIKKRVVAAGDVIARLLQVEGLLAQLNPSGGTKAN